MNVGVFIVGLIILIPSFLLARKGHKMKQALYKYEFENRTNGGVVQFESYEASQAHQRRHSLADFIKKTAGLPVLLGLAVVAASFFI